jgi:hypothetical protein
MNRFVLLASDTNELLFYADTFVISIAPHHTVSRASGSLVLLAAASLLASWLPYSSVLTMEAVRSSETSVNFCQARRRYNPEDNILHSYSYENFKSNTTEILSLVSLVSHLLDTKKTCIIIRRKYIIL